MSIRPGCSEDEWYSIPSRSADFYLQYCIQTLVLIHHPVIVFDSMVLYLPSLICSRVCSFMRQNDKFTFTSYKNMTLYTALDRRKIQEKCHNQWIPTNIWKEITTSFPWLGVHILKRSPQLDSTESRRHRLYLMDPKCHQNDTFARVLAQGGDS